MRKYSPAVLLALAAVLPLGAAATKITFECQAKVKESVPAGAVPVGTLVDDLFVFDDVEDTVNRLASRAKADVTPGRIAARFESPGTVMTISVTRPMGVYVATLSKSDPSLRMTADGKCTERRPDPSSPSYGTVSGSVYTNPFLGMTIRVAQGWRVLDETDSRAVARMAQMQDAAPAMIMLPPEGSRAGAVIFTLRKLAANANADEFVRLSRDTAAKANGTLNLSDTTVEKLGGRPFSTFRWNKRAPDGREAHTKFFLRVEKGHGMVFAVDYFDDKGLAETERPLKEMKF